MQKVEGSSPFSRSLRKPWPRCSPPRPAWTRRARCRPRTHRSASISWLPVSTDRATEQLELSEGRWLIAIRNHAQPPPDAGCHRTSCARHPGGRRWRRPRRGSDSMTPSRRSRARARESVSRPSPTRSVSSPRLRGSSPTLSTEPPGRGGRPTQNGKLQAGPHPATLPCRSGSS
jgi:hypothetical protein